MHGVTFVIGPSLALLTIDTLLSGNRVYRSVGQSGDRVIGCTGLSGNRVMGHVKQSGNQIHCIKTKVSPYLN